MESAVRAGWPAFFGEALGTGRAPGSNPDFQLRRVTQALWAPGVLHTGLGPESAVAPMGK